MLIKDYIIATRNTDVLNSDGRALAVRRYGLFGQVGALLELIKKESREAQLIQQSNARLEELGDIAWYTCALIDQTGNDALIVFRDAANEIGIQVTDHIDSFESLDEACKAVPLQATEDEFLHSLAASAGALLSVHPSCQNDHGALMHFVAALLRLSVFWHLSLAEAVRLNVAKTSGRWPGTNPTYGERLDSNAKLYEQLPRELTFSFVQREIAGCTYVYPQILGLNIGDRLTDNRHEPDGYRFHDIFHIAYAVHLGWSPVLRSLLKLKRRNDARTDENEDGARAMIIEEGIATWIFNHAARDGNNYYDGIDRGQLPYRLLKQVREMTRGYEVYARPLWQWDAAIIDGFRVFRKLLKMKGGSVTAHFHEHRLAYTPPMESVE